MYLNIDDCSIIYLNIQITVAYVFNLFKHTDDCNIIYLNIQMTVVYIIY